MSLYTKHRPQQFADLVGQDHIKTTLANALKNGTFSHAYIFAGPKGSGKTTTARLLAKALNCTGIDLASGKIEPCEKCTSCLEVTAGHSMDVMEIDAASNRGIDEIRDLREKIKFAPTAGRYKVYIIDECHMLTKEAFNALLKTLEEPPKHAVFVLATTELHKVPATILSRAQLFDFKKAKTEEVLGLLETVAKKEKIKIEPEALQLLARLAYGAYRDALTLLDQVASIQVADGGQIKLSDVQQVLGQATEESVWDLVEALSQKDRNLALKIVNNVYFEGKDLSYFCGEVIGLLRKVLLMQADLSNQFEVSHEEKEKIDSFAQSFTSAELVLAIQKISGVLGQVKASILGQLPLEMVIFEITNLSENQKSNIIGSASRSAEISKEIIMENDNVKIKNDEVVKSGPVIQKQDVKPVEKESDINIDESKSIEKSDAKPELSAIKVVKMIDSSVAKAWTEIVKIVKKDNNVVAAMLREAVVTKEEDEKITLGVANAFQAKQLCNATIRQVIESAIFEVVGRNFRIECIVDADMKQEKPAEPEETLLNDVKDIFEI